MGDGLTKQQRYVLKKRQNAVEYKKFRVRENLSDKKYRYNVKHKVKSQGNVIKDLSRRILNGMAMKNATIK